MTNQTDTTEKLKANIEQDVKAAKDELTGAAKSAKDDLAGAAKAQAEAGKDQAAHKLNDLSEAIDQVANSISENDKLGLASYVHSTSSQLAALANRLQNSSLDQLAEEAKDLARRKPTAFMLGSVMVGFGLSRFIKASVHPQTGGNGEKNRDDYGSGADFKSSQPMKSYADPASPYPTNAEI